MLGMVARNDRHHDIAAWFGVNQGRVADAQKGKYGTPEPEPAHVLPPVGPPGIKGRRLRLVVTEVLTLLSKGNVTDATKMLGDAADKYDSNEI